MPEKKQTKIPDSIICFLQEYDIEEISAETHRIPIIERVLEMGSWEDLHWVFHHYGVARIREYVQNLGHRRLSPMTFNYWRKLLEIKEYRRAPWEDVRKDLWRF